ncbi:serum amyloid A [Salminus brasiliensis]|uniref:serum amyloid A n=1 Tax=Salminus brasiliensis TaxID=930266 RepID=UPI003B83435A
MKLTVAVLALVMMAVGVCGQWYNFPAEAVLGAADMWDAYTDMKEANWKKSDHYFHARGNYEAAQRGPGGKWVAELISDGREYLQNLNGQAPEDAVADQWANQWGREGGDPNVFRPNGLPSKY